MFALKEYAYGSRTTITQSGSSKACRKPFGQIFRTELCHKKATWLLSTVLNCDNGVFWASLETNFTRKICTLEAKTSVSV